MIRLARTSVTTDSTGAGEILVKVPGTFTGLDPTDPNFSGRAIEKAEIFFGSFSPGDHIVNFALKDVDGILAAESAGIPGYPILGTWTDMAIAADNQGLYFPPGDRLTITPPAGNNRVPSGMYLSVTVQKSSAVVDTCYGNILWDDGK